MLNRHNRKEEYSATHPANRGFDWPHMVGYRKAETTSPDALEIEVRQMTILMAVSLGQERVTDRINI